MKSTTSIQRVTIAMLISYIFWELGIWIWTKNLPPHDPVIRVDLMIIYPFLFILILISIYQYFKINSSKK